MNIKGILQSLQGILPKFPQKHSDRKYDAVVKLLCVFCAFLLWIYVMQVDSPQHEDNITAITVQIEGEEALAQYGLSIYSGRGNLINIKVAGKRSIVSKVFPEDIVATVDVSSITEPGRHPLDIRIDLPSGLALLEKSQDTINVYVDASGSVTLPIRTNFLNMDLPDNYEIGRIGLEYNSITVTGPQNVLSNIRYANLDIDLSGRTRSFTTKGKVYLTDAYNNVITSPYVTFLSNEIEVDVPIYKSVTVPVDVLFRYGYLNDTNAYVTVTPSEVVIKGDEKAFEVEQLLMPIVLDEKQIYSSQYGRTVTLQSAAGTFIDGDVTEVEVEVSLDYNLKTMDFTIQAQNIEATGADGIQYEIQTGNLVVTLRGTKEKLARIQSADIIATVDLSGYSSDSRGVITVPIRITIDAEDADDVYELGEYTVAVKIS